MDIESNIIKKFNKTELHGANIHVRRKSGDQSYRLHWHTYYEITYYRNCKGKVVLNGKDFNISDNSLFLLTPKDFHKIEMVVNPVSESINISFTKDMVDPAIIRRLASGPRIYRDVPKELIDVLYITDTTYTSDSDHKIFRLKQLLNFILSLTLEHSRVIDVISNYITPAVGDAIAYMILNANKGVSLAEVSEYVNLSPSYLSDIFHRETGITFKKYLNELRIEQAKRLLEDSRQPILGVCYESGFNTLSQFMKVFKDSTGFSPAEYRKAHSI